MIYDLAIYDDGVLAGGRFYRAGEHLSHNIARWDTILSSKEPQPWIRGEPPDRNPGLRIRSLPEGQVSLSYTLPAPQRVRAGVYDVQGRRIRTLLDQFQVSGNHSLTWGGTARGVRVPNGVYWIRLSLGDETETRKTILNR